MDTYLVGLSLGPVQSLIEAARRTRDLWCGSWLLSEASKAAALYIHKEYPDSLVFPHTENPAHDLRAEDEPNKDMDKANVSNIIRALVPNSSEEGIRALCDGAKQAAAGRLAQLCEGARGKPKLSELPLHDHLWEKQVRDILECYAAWTVVPPGEDYGSASKRLGGIHAARKATRDFSPAATGPESGQPGYGVPKSSLDGARESVINLGRKEREEKQYRTALRILGLSSGEQLDALGLAKRAAAKAEQFTAFSRIAADSWLRDLTDEQRQRLGGVYEPLVGDDGLATGVSGNKREFEQFPYDAQLLYDFRLDNALDRGDLEQDEKDHLRALRREIERIGKEKNAKGEPVGAPVPYAVVLKGDGDRMGALLSAAKTEKQARAISSALSGFADSVRDIVRKRHGHAIYSGGDDVLALLPLQTSMEAARALATAFAEAMGPVAKDLGLEVDAAPTLSVGIGIGHVMEPLGGLRARADAAEKAAKGDLLDPKEQRNALAIQLGIRSGGEYRWRAQWKQHDDFTALEKMRLAYEADKLPSRVAYDIRDIGERLKWLDRWIEEVSDVERKQRKVTAADMRRAEVRRTLDRARTDGGDKAVDADLQKLLLGRVGTEPDTLTRLADSLILARWLAARTAADVGEQQ